MRGFVEAMNNVNAVETVFLSIGGSLAFLLFILFRIFKGPSVVGADNDCISNGIIRLFILFLTLLLVNTVFQIYYKGGVDGGLSNSSLNWNDFFLLSNSSANFILVVAFAVLIIYFVIVLLFTFKILVLEFVVIVLLNLLVVVLSISSNFIEFFIAFEGVSLALYVLITSSSRGIKGRSIPSRGGLYYLLFGLVASAVAAVALSYLVLSTGGLFEFKNVFFLLSGRVAVEGEDWITSLALILLLGAFLFKMGAAPFHSWVGPVYQSVPDRIFVLLLLYTKPVMGAVLLVKFYPLFFLYKSVMVVIGISGVLSILVGFFLAVAQTKIRRILAFSGVVNVGYLFLTLSITGDLISFIIYLAAYVLTLWLVLLSLLSYRSIADRQSFPEEVGDFYARVRTSKIGSGITMFNEKGYSIGVMSVNDLSFILSLFAIMGIPPFAIFFGKYLLLYSICVNDLSMGGSIPILFFLIFSVLTAVYYMFIVRNVVIALSKDYSNRLVVRSYLHPTSRMLDTLRLVLTVFLFVFIFCEPFVVSVILTVLQG